MADTDTQSLSVIRRKLKALQIAANIVDLTHPSEPGDTHNLTLRNRIAADTTKLLDDLTRATG